MKRSRTSPITIAVGIAALGITALADAQAFSWTTVVNNAVTVPGCAGVPETRSFNSYSQPSVNEHGLVTFRGRSKGSDGGDGELEEGVVMAPTAATGKPARGVYTRDMAASGAVQVVACVGAEVPQPNNTDYNGKLAVFNEFPAFPRIDARSPTIASRGQSQPVYEYQVGVDPSTGSPLTTKTGTSGIYTNPGGALMTGASLLGAVTDYPPTKLIFPQYSVPGVPAGTRFDQFPGAPTITAGTVIGFKGNFTIGTTGYTGVYFRDVSRASNPTYLVADSYATRIPNQPRGGTTLFGSTAPPTAMGQYMYFVGSDDEDNPSLGGIYRAKMRDKEAQRLTTLVGVGDQVPGEAPGTGFRKFGEALSVSPDGGYVSFWGTWGTEATEKTLLCPEDGNADLIAYCNENYPGGQVVSIPVHQGIFIYDVTGGKLHAIAKTGQDGMEDFLYWVFSGSPPGVGGNEEDTREPPRWRSSAFTAASFTEKRNYAVAFKGTQAGLPGIFLKVGSASLLTVARVGDPGQSIDPAAPAGSLVTAIGIERDGFRGSNLAITASMLYETSDESLGWAGIYLTKALAARR